MTTESQVVFKQATLRYTYQEKSGIVVGSTNQRDVPVKVIYSVDKRTGKVTAYQNDTNANLSTVKPSDLTALAIWSPTLGKKGRWISTTNKTIPTSAPNDPTWDELIQNSYNKSNNETVLNKSIKESVNDDTLFTAEERNLITFPGVNQTSVDTNAPTADPPEGETNSNPTPADSEQGSVSNRVLVRSGNFGTWTYPKELPMNVSDLIQFTIIEYTTRVATGQKNTNKVQVPDALKILSQSVGESRALADVKGTINLAIQPPVTDTNGVNWTDTGINLVQLGAAAGSLGFIQGGFGGASGVLNQIAQGEAADAKNIREALKVFFAQKASQASNLLSRLTGSVLNPNLETLFEGPRTRSFNYQFQFTPRDEDEATEVRSIIRTFKEAMAVKRTESLGFLKAPYVFNIRYLYQRDPDNKAKDHPYIGRVKGPCALKDMQTDYTPEGSYMTYEGGKDGGSMVKYTVTLVFQELDPVYADDYVALGNENIIGY